MSSKRHRAKRSLRVGVVGGGLGGIAMGVKLKRAGIEEFTIFEREAGPGGTWWVNDYPGSEIDVSGDVYAYSFEAVRWSRTHARQPELLAYIEKTVRDNALTPHFRFGTSVSELRWLDEAQQWMLRTATDEEFRFDVVVSAVGFLSNPKVPDWEGMDTFEGKRFHTTHWDHEYDLNGKTVAVVGVGSTAAQVVPTIAPKVKHLYVFQREPGWVLPKGDRDYSEREARRRSHPLRYRFNRYRTFVKMERSQWGGAIYRPGTAPHTEAEQVARRYIDSVFKDRPDLKEAVTPKYVFSGKRRVLSDDYYPALLRENVELVTKPVQRLTSTGVIDEDGVERDVDLLVMATGFSASSYLSSLKVTGRNGRDLQETWKDGAFAFLGMAVPGFPNFYMLYGPNTNGGTPITQIHERQADFVMADLKRMVRHNLATIEVKSLHTDVYNVWLQHKMKATAWVDANNYFSAPSGRIVTQFPDGMIKYMIMLRLLHRPSIHVERKL